MSQVPGDHVSCVPAAGVRQCVPLRVGRLWYWTCDTMSSVWATWPQLGMLLTWSQMTLLTLHFTHVQITIPAVRYDISETIDYYYVSSIIYVFAKSKMIPPLR